MSILKGKHVCILDSGLFVWLAVRLAKDVGESGTVSYYMPVNQASPTSSQSRVGTGLPGVTKVTSWVDLIGSVDLWIVPYLGFAVEQEYLRSLGERVFGCGLGEELETRRDYGKEVLKRVGLPVGKYVVVTGVDAAREYAKKNKDVYVKTNGMRGDFETFCAHTPTDARPMFDELAHLLGAMQDEMPFLIEHEVAAVAEAAYDTVACVDGQFAKHALVGVERKDMGYIGKVTLAEQMPKALQEINKKLGPVFKRYGGYRGPWGNEVRLTKEGEGYLIDYTCRWPEPPGGLHLSMKNLGDVLWAAAEGKIVEPQYPGVWGAELLLRSDWIDQHSQPITFPDPDVVRFWFCCAVKGKYYVLPQPFPEMGQVGSVVGWGNTADAAIDAAKANAKAVTGFGIEKDEEALDEARAALAKVMTV